MICIEHEDCRTNMTLSMACFKRTFATVGARFIWHTACGPCTVEVIDDSGYPNSVLVNTTAGRMAIHLSTAAVVRLEE